MQKTVILGLALSVLMIACEDYDLKKIEDVNLTDNLIAYYPFNGNANDESGNGNHGTVNGATLTTDRFGNPGKAFSFDGIDDRITIPHTSIFNFGTTSFTVCVWMKAGTISNIGVLVGKFLETPGWDQRWALNIQTNGRMGFHWSNETIIGARQITSLSSSNDQNYHLFTVVVDRNALPPYPILYIDGITMSFDKTGSSPGSIDALSGSFDNNEPISIGHDNVYNYPFAGSIDDIRIYNRAISPSEVQALYHEGGWPGSTVSDIDGNVYHTVQIGTQTWMVENLKTTRYRNGEAIPNVTDNGAWTSLTTGAYCNYDNNSSNANTYGRLYNWYAVNDSRNIAPAGWRVPTDNDWTILVNYLGGESVAGGKLKEAGTAHWLSPNTGADNSSGFTALPGGDRHFSNGDFAAVGNYGHWWSSLGYDATNAWYRDLYYFSAGVYPYYGNKRYGLSVRCVRD